MKSVVWLFCRQCATTFKRRSKKHFKCPKCGSHFTEQIESPEDSE